MQTESENREHGVERNEKPSYPILHSSLTFDIIFHFSYYSFEEIKPLRVLNISCYSESPLSNDFGGDGRGLGVLKTKLSDLTRLLNVKIVPGSI